MAVLAVILILSLSATLIYAGSVKLNRRAERWERYERWLHPPDDDDDGVSLLEDEKHADNQ